MPRLEKSESGSPSESLVVVLDTNVAGSLLKDEPPAWLALYEPILASTMRALSVQTEGELRRWALRSGWGPERWARLDALLASVLVLPADRTTAAVWGRLMAHAEERGRALGAADGWVAATAVANGLPLVTHDKDLVGLDFAGLSVICHA